MATDEQIMKASFSICLAVQEEKKKGARACRESVTCFWMYDKIDAIKFLLRS